MNLSISGIVNTLSPKGSDWITSQVGRLPSKEHVYTYFKEAIGSSLWNTARTIKNFSLLHLNRAFYWTKPKIVNHPYLASCFVIIPALFTLRALVYHFSNSRQDGDIHHSSD